MKNKTALIFSLVLLNSPLGVVVAADPVPAKDKPIEKPKDPAKPEKGKGKEAEKPLEQDTLLGDFLANKPYDRENMKKIPSPFRNLITVEKFKRIAEEKEKERLKKLEESKKLNKDDPFTAVNNMTDDKAKKFIILQESRKNMDLVQQLVEIRKYDLAEEKLSAMDAVLVKYNIEEYRDEISKKKVEVVAEHKDWDEVNKILASLTVDAMFVAEGKKKVALINDIAVEEGDDLNDMLSLAKDSPVILTFVSNNSLKIKYKKFTLQKELVDNDL
jgi:hypothetical protein